jgi:hypothetical protein
MALVSTLLAVLAMSPAAPQERKTVLPNGVALYAENMPKSGGFTLHLFVSALGEPEKDGQRGHRHLLEHLVAKGRNRDLDARLESHGLYLTADTLQDGVRFEIEGAADGLPVAIEALKELFEFPAVTQEEVAREVKIVREETGVRTFGSRLSAALYEAAFGSPDPIGTSDELAKATPEELKSVYQALFVPSRMAVAVVGEVDVVKAVADLTGVLIHLDGPQRPPKSERALIAPQRERFVEDGDGCGRGVAVKSLSMQETLDTLAAAFAIAGEIPGAQVLYTPSAIGGLVSVVHPIREGLDDVDRLVAGEANRLYRTGLSSVRLWAETAGSLTREKARLYGQILLLENFFRTEDMVRRAASVSQAGFTAALKKFDSRACVRAGGVR